MAKLTVFAIDGNKDQFHICPGKNFELWSNTDKECYLRYLTALGNRESIGGPQIIWHIEKPEDLQPILENHPRFKGSKYDALRQTNNKIARNKIKFIRFY